MKKMQGLAQPSASVGLFDCCSGREFHAQIDKIEKWTKQAFPVSRGSVGIIFELHEEDFCVQEIVEGGAAAESGQVQVGDRLLQVDDTPIGASLTLLHGRIRGQEGTFVSLYLEDDQGRTKLVRLKRKAAPDQGTMPPRQSSSSNPAKLRPKPAAKPAAVEDESVSHPRRGGGGARYSQEREARRADKERRTELRSTSEGVEYSVASTDARAILPGDASAILARAFNPKLLPVMVAGSLMYEGISGHDIANGGVGVHFRPHEGGGLQVQQVVRGGPAFEEGTLQPGDVVMAVNGCVVAGKSPEDIAALVCGPVGTTVVLSAVRDGREVTARVSRALKPAADSVSAEELPQGAPAVPRRLDRRALAAAAEGRVDEGSELREPKQQPRIQASRGGHRDDTRHAVSRGIADDNDVAGPAPQACLAHSEQSLPPVVGGHDWRRGGATVAEIASKGEIGVQPLETEGHQSRGGGWRRQGRVGLTPLVCAAEAQGSVDRNGTDDAVELLTPPPSVPRRRKPPGGGPRHASMSPSPPKALSQAPSSIASPRKDSRVEHALQEALSYTLTDVLGCDGGRVNKNANKESRQEGDVAKDLSASAREHLPSPAKAVHMAARYGRTDSINQLAAQGVDVNVRDLDLVTPLMRAARYGHTQTVMSLLEQRADIDAQDSLGATALIFAARHGRLSVVHALCDAGCDMNLVDERGCTALIVASKNWQTTVVAELVERRANVDLVNHAGETALQVALQKSRSGAQADVLDILEPRRQAS